MPRRAWPRRHDSGRPRERRIDFQERDRRFRERPPRAEPQQSQRHSARARRGGRRVHQWRCSRRAIEKEEAVDPPVSLAMPSLAPRSQASQFADITGLLWLVAPIQGVSWSKPTTATATSSVARHEMKERQRSRSLPKAAAGSVIDSLHRNVSDTRKSYAW